jgi:hypothetical protein
MSMNCCCSGHRQRQHRFADLGIVREIAQKLLARPHEDVALAQALHMNSGRRGQRERLQRMTVAHRDLRRDPAAERGAREMHAGEAKLLHRVEIEIRKIADVIEPIGRVGGAEAWMVRHDHVEVPRQPLHERHPGRDAERASADTTAARPARRA